MPGRNGFNWGRLLMGIIFIITALVSFRNPLTDLIFLALMFGFIAISNGIWLILNRNDSFLRLLLGILDIVIGLVFIFNLGLSTAMMPYIFALWFLANAIGNLFFVKYTQVISKGFYWLNLIINILCIVLGVALLFDPISSTLTIAFLVGFYFMMVGLEFIVSAFQY